VRKRNTKAAPGGLFFFYISNALHEGESEMDGIIKFWNSEKQFGFAVTEAGEEFYVSAGRFAHPAARSGRLLWANLEGTRVRFDRAKTNSTDAAWTRKLNDGTLRDADVDPRNPRPPRRPRTKPVATNVVVIDPADSEKRGRS
jgi:cold shock CspA family protein